MKNRIHHIITLLLFALATLIPYKSYGKIFHIENLEIKGNKITKDYIIRREFTFGQGKDYLENDLDTHFEDTRENLMNTALFNYIYISYELSKNEECRHENTGKHAGYDDEIVSIDVTVTVEERWYIFPLISLNFEDRNISSWFKNMDFSRLSGDLGVIIDNTFGLNHSLSAGWSFGYKTAFFLKYDRVSLDRNGKHTLGFNVSHTMNKTENIYATGNTPQYIKSDNGYIKQYTVAHVKYTNRPILRFRHSADISYSHETIADTILKINPNYWGTEKTVRDILTLTYNMNYDQRNYVQYPTQGFYLSGTLAGTSDLNTNFKMLQFKADIQYYLKLSERWFASSELRAGISFKNKSAYIYDKAIGYNSAIMRGFEYVTIDGQHYITSNNTIRFCILPKKVFTINFLSFIPKFNKIHFTIYAKAFFDMGYAYNTHSFKNENLSNRFIYSAGAGIDLLTYYDIVLGAHFAVTNDGTPGMFFTLKTAIF